MTKGKGNLKVSPPPHPWRLCPAGQHWRRAHIQSTYQKKDGTIVKEHQVSAGCCDNPSGKDQLYPDEVREIAARHFQNLKQKPPALKLRKIDKDDPNTFDDLIGGWVQYWNEVFNPPIALDPNVIKALIASESRYNLKVKDMRLSTRNYARGLMQITDDTRKILADEKGELKEHLIHLTKDDVHEAGLSICAAVRWLFHKKNLASVVRLRREATWEEAILEYKGYLKDILTGKNKNPHGLITFRDELIRLKGKE